jgi:hypothetical protein
MDSTQDQEGRVNGELPDALTIRGRKFSHEELLRIRAIVGSASGEHRRGLSLKICEQLNWRQANGHLKDRSCRDVLLKLHEAGFLTLPPGQRKPNHRRPIQITAATDPRPVSATFGPRDVRVECFHIVTGARRSADERLWKEYVERYHYLRYGVPVGPHIKYFVRLHDQPIALLAFSGAAWKTAPRDRWIGWSQSQRQANLHLVVNNTRFLILPWIRVDNLASRIIALAAKRLPEDWNARYAYRPLLLETFVHTERHVGTCYRAANWICAGTTQGRGKTDRRKTFSLPRKLVFLHPLVSNAQRLLTD